MELGVYLSASCWLFLESRKHNADFMLMIAHHVVTILLMSLAYSHGLTNFFIGVAAIHDFSDVILELSKVLYYNKLRNIANYTWVAFTASFTISRLYFYPKYFVLPWYNGVFAQHLGSEIPFAKWFKMLFPGLLSSLVVMHAIWSYFIIRVCLNAIKGKTPEKDYEGKKK